MSPPTEHVRRFVDYLESLLDDDGTSEAGASAARPGEAARRRAALARLRRGLGAPPGQAAEMYPYVIPWIRENEPPWREEPYYLVAALFAWHQRPWQRGPDDRRPTNLGASFARLVELVPSESIEERERIGPRFTALLGSHREDLPQHLRHAVGLLKSKDVEIDWAQLLTDIQEWDPASRSGGGRRRRPSVQREWARAFWGSRSPTGGAAGTAEATASDEGNDESSDENVAH